MPGKYHRIGLFGGTFDPIHRGHLKVAREVREKIHLERIYFIPAAQPPHKPTHHLAGARDRMEMIRLAVSGRAGFAVSDVELKRSGPSYTVDTIGHFKSILPEETELFFILGADAFYEIDTWKSYNALFKLIPFVVMARPGGRRRCNGIDRKEIERLIHARISTGYRFVDEQACFVHDEKQPIYLCAVQPVDISSTRIRQRLRAGRSIHGLVPESVENYIKNRGLYR